MKTIGSIITVDRKGQSIELFKPALVLPDHSENNVPLLLKTHICRETVETEHFDVQVSTQERKGLSLKSSFCFSPHSFNPLRVDIHEVLRLLVRCVLRVVTLFFCPGELVHHVRLEPRLAQDLVLNLNEVFFVVHLVVLGASIFEVLV